MENAVAAIVEAENGNIILRNAARQILLVRQRTDEQMRALALRLCKMARQTFGVYLCAGIDGEAGDVHKAYAQANTAWRSARMTRSGVMKYDQVTLELVADEVSRQTKMEFIRKVFRGCGYEEVRRWMGILEAYYESEGSISAAAQALYMHKNTLQYKLKNYATLQAATCGCRAIRRFSTWPCCFSRKSRAACCFWTIDTKSPNQIYNGLV